MFTLFALIYITCLYLNNSEFTKSVTLTPQNLNEDGATMNTPSPTEISSSATQWNINSNSEQTWHLMANLDNSWGFHNSLPSTISVEINSPTTPGSSTFDDITIAFTVLGSNEWFGIRLYMDNTGDISRITPSCDNTNPYDSQSLISGDLSTILNGGSVRRCSLGLNSCGSNYSPMSPSGQSNSWPIKFNLQNHPNNYVLISYQGSIIQSCGINNGFNTNQGLQIYFALARASDTASINNFKITYSYIPISNTYKTITGTFNDDYILSPPQGWIIQYSTNAIKNTVITTSSNTGLTYHGPYKGDSDSATSEIYTISQEFYCNVDSSVHVTYYIYYCETEASDFVKLYLNNILQVTTTIDITTGNTYSDNTLLTECSTTWKSVGPIGPYSISSVNTNNLFQVKFELSVTNNGEGVAISRTQITCNPLTTLTNNPTPAPTSNPTPAPTSNPTPTPTNQPTPSPTNQPTFAPIPSPTLSPTKLPTQYPTKTPINEPTKSPITSTPTKSPTNQPSITPTVNPSTSPTKSPSKSPSFNPTKYPTKFPTRFPTSTPTDFSNIPTVTPTLSPIPPTTPSPNILSVDKPTRLPTKSPTFESGNVPEASTTEIKSEGDSLEGNNMNTESEINNIMFFIIGASGAVVCGICCFMVVYFMKRKQNKNMETGSKLGKLASSSYMTTHVGNRSPDTEHANTNNFAFPKTNDNIVTSNQNASSIAMTNMQIENQFPGSLSFVPSFANFEATLVNLSGANNLLMMNDVVNDMQNINVNDVVNDTYITNDGHNVTAGGDIEITESTNEDMIREGTDDDTGEMIINDDDDMIIYGTETIGMNEINNMNGMLNNDMIINDDDDDEVIGGVETIGMDPTDDIDDIVNEDDDIISGVETFGGDNDLVLNVEDNTGQYYN